MPDAQRQAHAKTSRTTGTTVRHPIGASPPETRSFFQSATRARSCFPCAGIGIGWAVILVVVGAMGTVGRVGAGQVRATHFNRPAPWPAVVVPPLLFSSGWESTVALSAAVDDGFGSWVQNITGADQGYTWTSSMPQRGGKTNQFVYEVPVASTLSTYITTEIRTVTGWSGASTRALFIELKSLLGANPEARDQFSMYPETTRTQMYAKYRMKLQSDLATVLPAGNTNSVIISEAFETDGDFRWQLKVQRTPGQANLFWRALGQLGVTDPDLLAWQCDSLVAVPLNTWFTMEQFWKQGTGLPGTANQGRIWYAVNGVSVVDYQGVMQVGGVSGTINIFWPWKVYVGSQALFGGGATLNYYIDDVEIRADIPSDSLYPATPPVGTNSCTTF